MPLIEKGEKVHDHVCAECEEVITEGCTLECDAEDSEDELCEECSGELEAEIAAERPPETEG